MITAEADRILLSGFFENLDGISLDKHWLIRHTETDIERRSFVVYFLKFRKFYRFNKQFFTLFRNHTGKNLPCHLMAIWLKSLLSKEARFEKNLASGNISNLGKEKLKGIGLHGKFRKSQKRTIGGSKKFSGPFDTRR